MPPRRAVLRALAGPLDVARPGRAGGVAEPLPVRRQSPHRAGGPQRPQRHPVPPGRPVDPLPRGSRRLVKRRCLLRRRKRRWRWGQWWWFWGGFFASIGRALGGFFGTIARGLQSVSSFIREYFPGAIAAPLAGLVDMLGGLSRTLSGIFSGKADTVLGGLGDLGKGFLSIFGLKEVLTKGFQPPPTRTDALGNVRELPTGMPLPKTLANDLWDAQNATQADANLNGMHSWHAASNAHIATRVGPIGAVFLWLAGLYHETFDFQSFSGEQYWQGTVNHTLDSLTDIVANTFGILIGMILPRKIAVDAASWLGNYIPGPGEPDPAFGGPGTPYGSPPNPNDPKRAWGHYPPLRGPGTTRTPLLP